MNIYIYIFFCLLLVHTVSKGQEKPEPGCGIKLTEEEAIAMGEWYDRIASPPSLIETLRSHNIPVPGDYFSKVDEYGLYNNRKLSAGHLIAAEKRRLGEIKDSVVNDNSMGEVFALNGSSVATKYYVPVQVWMHQDNAGVAALNENEMLARLRVAFATIREATAGTIELYIDDVANINNSPFFVIANEVDENQMFFGTNDALEIAIQNATRSRLNIHFVSDGPGAGSAHKIPSHDLWVEQGTPLETLVHEIGHCFGLVHTHQSHWLCAGDNDDCSNCYQESVSRTRTNGAGCFPNAFQRKCETNGDKLCDTPADPNVQGFVFEQLCLYGVNGRDLTDNWGDMWTPPTDNIMSLSFRRGGDQVCRENFSLGQVGVMISRVSGLSYARTSADETIAGPTGILCPGSDYFFFPPDNTLEFYLWDVSDGLEILTNVGNSIVVRVDATPPFNEECRSVYLNGVPFDNNFIGNEGYSVAAFDVTINDMKLAVTGSGALPPDGNCRNYTTEYYTGAYYNWSISGGGTSPPQICSGQGTNNVLLSAGAGSADFSLFVSTTISCGNLNGSRFISIGNNDGGLPVPLESHPTEDIIPHPKDLFDQLVSRLPSGTGGSTLTDLIIYDMRTGRKLQEIKCVDQHDKEIMKSLGRGMYVIQFRYSDKIYSRKIVKQ